MGAEPKAYDCDEDSDDDKHTIRYTCNILALLKPLHMVLYKVHTVMQLHYGVGLAT